jgi:hypothetical protein
MLEMCADLGFETVPDGDDAQVRKLALGLTRSSVAA